MTDNMTCKFWHLIRLGNQTESIIDESHINYSFHHKMVHKTFSDSETSNRKCKSNN